MYGQDELASLGGSDELLLASILPAENPAFYFEQPFYSTDATTFAVAAAVGKHDKEAFKNNVMQWLGAYPPPGLDAQLLEIFAQLVAMPRPCQELLGRLMLRLAIKIRQSHNPATEVKSMGADRLVIYLRLQDKWPDVVASPWLAKALKAALMLDMASQTVFCFYLMEPLALLELYLETRRLKAELCSLQEVQTLLKTVLLQGSEKAHKLLQSLFDENS